MLSYPFLSNCLQNIKNCPKPPSIPCLPEIHNNIFAHLDPVTSLCVGLASKRLYEVHKSFHGVGTLSLLSQTQFFEFGQRFCLVELLEEWLEDCISARMMKFYLEMADVYAEEDAKHLRNSIQVWKEIPRYELEALMVKLDGGDHRMFFHGDISRAAHLMLLTYSPLELDIFLNQRDI